MKTLLPPIPANKISQNLSFLLLQQINYNLGLNPVCPFSSIPLQNTYIGNPGKEISAALKLKKEKL